MAQVQFSSQRMADADARSTGAFAEYRVVALQRQLRDALQSLGALRARCEQLEAQLRDGRQRERRHQHRAEHDDLTGLLNRTAFRERVTLTLKACAKPVVLLLDLDDFKQVNDNFGHAAGDEVLRIVAARLAHTLRKGDVVSRLGGDEFACLLPDVASAGHLDRLVAKLSAAIAAPIQVPGHRLCVSGSLGCSHTPEDGVCVDELLASADAAMYRSKRCRQPSGNGQGGFAGVDGRPPAAPPLSAAR